MELLLYRWSTAVQITSDLMIAVFFVALARSVRRVELRPWVNAWIANLVALLVTVAFWLIQPTPAALFPVVRWMYIFAKTLFVALLIVGAARFRRTSLTKVQTQRVVLWVAAYATAATLVTPTIDRLGTVQSAIIAIGMAAGAVLLLVRRLPGSGWLITGFAVRSLFAAAETVAYASQLMRGSGPQSKIVAIYIASASSFDTGGEWVIALGCVLLLYRTIQQELTDSNTDLLAAKSELQQLVDHDPLTGLSNRRGLPAILRTSFERGATIFFFDLNGFKDINDSYGHQAGDECLRRFARVLQASFRPGDAVVRYAGDEFVVIAEGVAAGEVVDRIDHVRDRLALERGAGPPIGFSAGWSQLPPHGDAEAAMHAADQAMYDDKRTRSSPRRRRA